MARPRISIFGLAGLIAFIALALACLLHASAPWAASARLAYFLALGTAPLGVVYLRREPQAFYLGFALWAWFYQFLAWFEEPITTGLLDWGYEVVIPADRQAKERPTVNVDLPTVNLEDGQIMDEHNVDVDIRDNGVLLAENVRPTSKRRTGPTTAHLGLSVDTVTASRLEDAKSVGAPLSVSRHRPRPLATLMTSPLVDRAAFHGVGYAILGILAGLAGGVIGKQLHAIGKAQREAVVAMAPGD